MFSVPSSKYLFMSPKILWNSDDSFLYSCNFDNVCVNGPLITENRKKSTLEGAFFCYWKTPGEKDLVGYFIIPNLPPSFRIIF